MGKKLLKLETHVHTDVDGETKSTQDAKSISVETQPDFVKMYVKDVGMLMGIGCKKHQLLFVLLTKMDYANQLFTLPDVRLFVKRTVGIEEGTLRKYIVDFCEKGIMTKKTTNVYLVNPFLFGKGKFCDIEKIRMSVVYDENGRTFESEIIKPDFSRGKDDE